MGRSEKEPKETRPRQNAGRSDSGRGYGTSIFARLHRRKPIRVYLAAAWSRQQEIRKVAEQLQTIGVEVTSRWLDERGPAIVQDKAKYRRETAFIDIQDVRRADMLIRFTDNLTSETIPSHLGTGARMFEFGLAWGAGIPVVVVGGTQNVFDMLPNLVHLKDLNELLEFLSTGAKIDG